MAVDIGGAFGSLPNALKIYDKRSEMLATNQANANTPGYKATDLDYKDILSRGQGLNVKNFSTNISDSRHIRVESITDNPDKMYRTVLNPSLDGNTVDSEVEKVQYADNMMRYMATLSIFKSKLEEFNLAIYGGRK